MYNRAIVRKPGVNFSGGITTSGLGVPDIAKALSQHEKYRNALEKCGIELTVLEADESYPDGCFVEDTTVIAGDIAVITRPGAQTRRGEENEIEKVISQYKRTARILAPGTLDGGDIMKAENHFYIGLSGRTNSQGAAQLAKILSGLGFTSSTVEVGAGLHLKSGIAYIGNGNFIAAPQFSGISVRGNIIGLSEPESYSANSLFVNGRLLIASGYPEMKAKVVESGYEVLELDMSEFRKMDGGLTCLSILFSA